MRRGLTTQIVPVGEQDQTFQDLCLIDYTHTEPNWVVRDLTKLEADIKFHLLKMNQAKDWIALVQLEEIISDQIAFDPRAAGDRTSGIAELQKAALAVQAIRTQAKSLLNRDSRIEHLAYWVYLYTSTLNALSYKNLSLSQYCYALISASLILRRHLSSLVQLQRQSATDCTELKLPPISGEGSERGLFPIQTRPEPLIKHPYKGLDYYDTEDRSIFFGREDEIENVVRLVVSHRVTMLIGKSGVGKSSLIRAGIVPDPRIEGHGYAPLYVRCVSPIIKLVNHRLAELIRSPGRKAGRLPARNFHPLLYEAETRLGKGILLCFDQLDSLADTEHRGVNVELARLANEIRICLDDHRLRTRFVLCVTGDSIPRLIELNVPELLNNLYVLPPLTPDTARRAITKPAELFGVEFEPALVTTILQDLNDSGQIHPPQLQIICRKLYETGTGSAISLAQYRELGGLSILGQYLEDALNRLPADLEREKATQLLRVMVPRRGGPIVCSESDLRSATRMTEGEIRRYLDTLDKIRLIRAVQLGKARKFELVHEFLADRVRAWKKPGEISVEDVHDLRKVLAGEVSQWKLSQRKQVTSSEEFARLRQFYKQLPIEDEDTAEFLLRSSLIHKLDIKDWFRHTLRKSPTKNRITSRLVELFNEGGRVQLAAVEALGEIQSDSAVLSLLKLLNDPNEKLKSTAILSLGRIGSQKAISPLIKLAASREEGRGTRRHSVWALGAIAAKRESRSALKSAIQPLMQVLSNAQNPGSVRWRAAWALGEIKAEEARELLMEMQGDINTHVRVAASRSLRTMQ